MGTVALADVAASTTAYEDGSGLSDRASVVSANPQLGVMQLSLCPPADPPRLQRPHASARIGHRLQELSELEEHEKMIDEHESHIQQCLKRLVDYQNNADLA